MKSIVHHAAPHVIPGANFTADRFAELYAWISGLAADSVQAVLSDTQYGLMIPYDGKAALEIELMENRIVMSRCVGITPQGTIIAIFDELHRPLTCDLSGYDLKPDQPCFVYAEVTHKNRLPFGPETSDFPLRPAFSMPSVRLHVQASGQPMAERPDAFPVGELVMENGAWKLSDYIPPCLHNGASPVLQARYLKYREAMRILLEVLPRIVRQTDSFQEKSMIELREMAIQLGNYLAAQRHRFERKGRLGNPFEVVEVWASFAQQFSFLLHCLADRPGFNDLLHRNTRDVNGAFFTPQSLENSIQELACLQYDHNQIKRAIAATDHFLQLIVPLFKGLSIGFLRPAENGAIVEAPQPVTFTW